jgi:hypothetical protein
LKLGIPSTPSDTQCSFATMSVSETNWTLRFLYREIQSLWNCFFPNFSGNHKIHALPTLPRNQKNGNYFGVVQDHVHAKMTDILKQPICISLNATGRFSCLHVRGVSMIRI